MRILIPIFFILTSFGIFFAYISNAYDGVKVLRAEEASYNDALQKSKELQAIRDALLSRYNTFSSEDISRLEKLLPNNIDNVRLVLELDSIASRYGMRVASVTVQGDAASGEDGTIRLTTDPFETVVLSFNVRGSYENFIAFLKDLESDLRIVDVSSLAFQGGDPLRPYTFQVSIKTYWLK